MGATTERLWIDYVSMGHMYRTIFVMKHLLALCESLKCYESNRGQLDFVRQLASSAYKPRFDRQPT